MIVFLWLVLCLAIELSIGIFLGQLLGFYIPAGLILIIGFIFMVIAEKSITKTNQRRKLIKHSREDARTIKALRYLN